MIGPLLRRLNERRARAYLQRVGLLPLLRSAGEAELPAVLYDLYNLHRLVRRRRPRIVLEFGVGFSTIVLAHAIAQNIADAPPGRPAKTKGVPPPAPQLWTMDASATWLENTRAKLPDRLREVVSFRHSAVRAIELAGQLCHRYGNLPNIVPDFVYLDGPDPADVTGAVDGLSFTLAHGGPRQVISADLLLMEPSLKQGFFLVVDGRFNNVQFLRHNLKRRYRVRSDRVNKLSTFELRERTGRH